MRADGRYSVRMRGLAPGIENGPAVVSKGRSWSVARALLHSACTQPFSLRKTLDSERSRIPGTAHADVTRIGGLLETKPLKAALLTSQCTRPQSCGRAYTAIIRNEQKDVKHPRRGHAVSVIAGEAQQSHVRRTSEVRRTCLLTSLRAAIENSSRLRHSEWQGGGCHCERSEAISHPGDWFGASPLAMTSHLSLRAKRSNPALHLLC